MNRKPYQPRRLDSDLGRVPDRAARDTARVLAETLNVGAGVAHIVQKHGIVAQLRTEDRTQLVGHGRRLSGHLADVAARMFRCARSASAILAAAPPVMRDDERADTAASRVRTVLPGLARTPL